MARLRQIAVAAVGGFSLALGLAGCMPDRPESVSPNAVLETSGNQMLTWSASSAGKVTVFDQSSDKIVYGSKVNHGQAVVVDVDKNKITLDDQVVSENSLHRGDQYRIFFEPTSTSRIETNQRIETDTVETTHSAR